MQVIKKIMSNDVLCLSLVLFLGFFTIGVNYTAEKTKVS